PIPRPLEKFEEQIAALFRMVTTLAVMLRVGMIHQPDPRIDAIMAEIQALSARVDDLNGSLTDSLDRLRGATGNILAVQMNEFEVRTGSPSKIFTGESI
ncbi:MAG: hypothetical protein HQK65_14680, partial [Desulfamplus sp.]|nr:hypothetical protein [Desulfamplus sp.]